MTMKKTIFLLLAAIFIAGCGRDQYSVEREYWRINRQVRAIYINPVATPENELNRVIALLKSFSQRYPGNMLAAQAEFAVGRLYLVKSMHVRAREQFDLIARKYPKSVFIATECAFLTGRSYQQEGKRDAAIAEYSKLARKYPLTPRGMQMPMYIARYYSALHEPQKAAEAYGLAIAHYRKLAEENPSSKTALQSYAAIANCYSAKRDWSSVAATLETISERFKDNIQMDAVYFNLGVIYKQMLKDDAKSKASFERIFKEYPRSRFVNIIKKLNATENGSSRNDRR